MVIKRIAVIVASLMLVLGMSATVFASQTPSNPTNTGSIAIEKNLVVTNPSLDSVDGPGATFTYSIAPEQPGPNNGGTTITDDQTPPHTATVHTGPASGVTLSGTEISYPIGTAVDASASGADNKKSITASVDMSKFSAPGVYRYKVTETADLGSCGATGTAGARYIDVYIENGASGLVCSGMVMHDGQNASTSKKTFDNAAFETVNIVLEKEVTGNMGDKNHEFPFAGTVKDTGRYFYANKGTAPTAPTAANHTATDTNIVAGNVDGSAVSTSLKHTEKYYISGVSHNATVAYTETNNTNDTYQVSITGGTASAASAVAGPTGVKEMTATDVDNAASVKFTNDLENVSPTGVVMRFGPYIGMVLAAIAFAFVFRRTRKANNA